LPAEGAVASGLRGGEEMFDAQLNAFREGKEAYQSAVCTENLIRLRG
jgi:hypothetical protein